MTLMSLVTQVELVTREGIVIVDHKITWNSDFCKSMSLSRTADAHGQMILRIHNSRLNIRSTFCNGCSVP